MRKLYAQLATTRGRLLLLGGLMVVAINLGAAVLLLTGDMDDYFDAVWWAFRHLVDPGSLGDDDEWDERLVGTGLALAGIVVFVGVVLSLVIEAVQRGLERLEDQPPPVRASGHVVVLGWGSLTPLVLDEVAALRHHDHQVPGKVVVVAPASLRGERDRMLAELRSHRRDLTGDVRFGDDDDLDVLDDVSLTSAASILVLPNDLGEGDPLAADLDVIGRASLVAKALEGHDTPPIVGYLVNSDDGYAAAAATLPPTFIGVAGDRAITGMLRLSIAAPPWGTILTDAMALGTEVALEVEPAGVVAGRPFAEATLDGSPRLPIGVDTADGRFVTDGSHVVAPGDRIVVVRTDQPWRATGDADPSILVDDERARRCRVLVVGWNQRVPTLLDDLFIPGSLEVEVVNVSPDPVEVRRAEIPRRLLDDPRCTLIEAALRDVDDCRAVLEETRPDQVLVMSSPRSRGDRGAAVRAADASAMFLAGRFAAVHEGDAEVLVDQFEPTSTVSLDGIGRIRAVPAARLHAVTLAGLLTVTASDNLLQMVFGDDDAPPFVGRVTTADGQPRPFAEVRAAALARGNTVLGFVDGHEIVVAPAPDRPVPSGAGLLLLRT